MNVDVNFTGTWFNSLLDPTQSLRLLKQDPRQEDDQIAGQVVNYAGRAVAEYGTERTRSTPLKFVKVPGAAVEQLRAWCGLSTVTALPAGAPTPLLLRDGAGWRRSGVIFGLSTVDMFPWDRSRRLYWVTLTFNDIAYAEGV